MNYLAKRIEAGDLKHGAGVYVLQTVCPDTGGHQTVEESLPAQCIYNVCYLARMPENLALAKIGFFSARTPQKKVIIVLVLRDQNQKKGEKKIKHEM